MPNPVILFRVVPDYSGDLGGMQFHLFNYHLMSLPSSWDNPENPVPSLVEPETIYSLVALFC